MSTLLEIEAAVELLPTDQQAELVRVLTARLNSTGTQPRKARLVRESDEVLLEAPPGCPTHDARKYQADAGRLAMSMALTTKAWAAAIAVNPHNSPNM